MSKIKSSLQECDRACTVGFYTWYDAFKGCLCGFNPCGIDTHFSHCILIKQVQAAATVHEDSGEVKSVNDWV